MTVRPPTARYTVPSGGGLLHEDPLAAVMAHRRGESAEARLYVAVIRDALRLARGALGRPGASEAGVWLLSAASGRFSFRWYCELLGIASQPIQRQLRREFRGEVAAPATARDAD